MKRKKRVQKAVFTAIFCYGAMLALFLGILRSTGQTRKILYGENAVMVQCTQNQTAAGTLAYTIELGGGEWSFSWEPAAKKLAKPAENLPPCMLKLLLRLAVLAESYTVECIQS